LRKTSYLDNSKKNYILEIEKHESKKIEITMALRPKHELGESQPAIERRFTDREEPIEKFKDFITTDSGKDYNILMYHGIGGIGKTTLRKELCSFLSGEKENAVWAVIDFDTQTFREQETALYLLRKSLSAKYKIQFPSFDIAYGIYWKRTHPQIQLNKDNFTLLGDSDPVIASIIEITVYAAGFGMLHKIGKGIIRGGKFLKNWWKKRGKDQISALSNMEPGEILEHLPMFWALDFVDFLEDSGTSAVLFIDTYEALWSNARAEGSFYSRDEWVRELVLQLPGVRWIFCGREQIRWDEVDTEWADCIKHIPLGNFSATDAMKFLTGCGIEDEEIKRIIFESSKGVPYYLDISVDTFHEIKRSHEREPELSDFAQTPMAIIDRFLRYLSIPEKETLKVLSAPRFFDYELFRDLVEEFGTGYPLTAFEDLCRFSFITESDIYGKFYMHELMRESLQNHQDIELKRRVHKFMFEYYNARLDDIDVKNITSIHKLALVESYHHGKHVFEPQKLFEYFDELSCTFREAGMWNLILSLYENMSIILEDTLGPEHLDVAKVLNGLAQIYHEQGRYSLTEPLFKRVLEINESALGAEHPDVAMALNNLAGYYFKQGNFKEAEPLLKRAMVLVEKALGPDHPNVAFPLTNLAEIYSAVGKYTEAEPLFKRVLTIYENSTHGEHPNVPIILNDLAVVYFKRGMYSEAEPLYMRALEIREKLCGPDHPDVAFPLSNLAELYTIQGKYSEARRLYERALQICEKALGQKHPIVAYILSELAKMCCIQGSYREAEPMYLQALEIQESVFGQKHPEVIETIKALAKLYRKIGKESEAQKLEERISNTE